MVWAAFNRNGAGLLHIVECIMDKVEGWNEIEYSNRTAIQNTQVTPRNSPDLNPIEHLRNDKQKPSNIKALEAIVKKAWAQISVRRCANLVDSMPRRCNFGCPTKY
uniref:DDE_3 domain-containing protein n=1 Tax=Heterorhabditis bacteriophora TaxID=37862 RepID=A0A1I7WE81_HETBA